MPQPGRERGHASNVKLVAIVEHIIYSVSEA